MSRLRHRLEVIEKELQAGDEGYALLTLFADETKTPPEYRTSYDGEVISEAEAKALIADFYERNKGRDCMVVRIGVATKIAN